MVGIVKLALRRPYTFIVMAVLIMIFGVASALRTPTDIFPNIDIPVVSVVFSFTGLPPDDMTGRIVTFYERALTTSVNDIELPRFERWSRLLRPKYARYIQACGDICRSRSQGR